MSGCKSLLYVVVFLLLIYLVACGCTKPKREGFETLSRPTFSTNLDPRNMNLRSDPYAYGGFVRGVSPEVDNLASYNKMATVSGTTGSQEYGPVSGGVYKSGMNDAGSYVQYIDPDYEDMNLLKTSSSGKYQGIDGGNHLSDSEMRKDAIGDSDFASLGSEGTFQSKKLQAVRKFESSLTNKNDSLKYTTPQELLPSPDMRQPLMRDPSDPSNFMYDRTVFAPLKKRNRNESDRFRGDLDIEPIKTGWFDIATIPTVDLVKGYFGFFNDIQEYQDLQDIAYNREEIESTGQDSSEESQKMTASIERLNTQMLRPSLKYATAPKLDFGPLDKEYQNSNPWYSTKTGRSKRDFEL